MPNSKSGQGKRGAGEVSAPALKRRKVSQKRKDAQFLLDLYRNTEEQKENRDLKEALRASQQEAAELRGQVAAQEAKLAQAEQKNQELVAVSAAQEVKLAQAEQKNKELAAVSATKDGQLLAQSGLMLNQGSLISTQHELILSLKAQLIQAQKRLAGLEEVIAEQDPLILAQQDTVDGLSAEVKTLEFLISMICAPLDGVGSSQPPAQPSSQVLASFSVCVTTSLPASQSTGPHYGSNPFDYASR